MDVRAVNHRHAELDQLIELRSKEAAEAEPFDSWRESARHHQERQQAQARWAWVRYHERQAAVHGGLAAEHLAKAWRLEGDVG